MANAAKNRCNELPCWAYKLLVTEIAGDDTDRTVSCIHLCSLVTTGSFTDSKMVCDDADPPFTATNGLWPRFVEITNTECYAVTLDSFTITRTDPSGEVSVCVGRDWGRGT